MSSGVVNSPTLTTAALWVPLKPFLGTHTISFRMVPQQVQRQLASLYQCVQPMWFQCPCLSLTGLRLWKQGCLVFPSPPLDVILSEINKSNSTFFSIGKWTQGLTLTRQVSNHLSHSPVLLLMAKQCFQKTLVLVFPCGTIQAELMGINGLY
jgi:hypothetical protein